MLQPPAINAMVIVKDFAGGDKVEILTGLDAKAKHDLGIMPVGMVRADHSMFALQLGKALQSPVHNFDRGASHTELHVQR
ncbi:MAG: hypothetical protein BWY75_03788 [bacterium ADurb.Bin425]|nr:MAG: hypothetical protein BWY75_03788 [bacterium ADurb.Bin425]